MGKGYFASGSSEDEPWLQAHKKQFPPEKMPPKRRRRAKRKSPPPIQMGNKTQICPHCRREAPVDTFRGTKCLGCQAGDFLQTL